MNLSNSYSEIILQKIGVKIKELRVNKGYTSYERFAIEHDLDRKQYWRVEKGTNITLKTLIKVLKIHQIKLSDFFKMVEEESLLP